MKKKKFLDHKKSKLHSRGYGTFQVIEQINDNAYKLKLLSEYNVSAIFNVFNHFFNYVGDDLRLNLFKKRKLVS
jgi:hypothetical protein